MIEGTFYESDDDGILIGHIDFTEVEIVKCPVCDEYADLEGCTHDKNGNIIKCRYC